MSALDAFRNELRALLGPGVFLRRDRTMRALFVCDAPRRLADAAAPLEKLASAGYLAADEGTLWRIDLSPSLRQRLIAALKPGPAPKDPFLRSLCRSLRAQGDIAPEQQPWPPIRNALLRLDAGETDQLTAELAAGIAVLKRTHAPLPLAAAYLIEEAQAEGGVPCSFTITPTANS